MHILRFKLLYIPKVFSQPHYNTVNPFVIIKGGAVPFIDFVEKVFGAKENSAVRTPDRDGSLIHAEIQLGDSMILLCDSKPDWPFTPSFLQVYVDDAASVIEKAKEAGAILITPLSDFYNGVKLARIQDPWSNLWWLYERVSQVKPPTEKSTTDWHQEKPSEVYLTLMEAMKSLNTLK